MLQLITTLAGASFRGKATCDLVRQMSIGDTCTLEREDDNPYDALAVKIMLDGTHIGYVAKINNGPLALAMEDGVEFSARVVDFESPIKPVFMVEENA